MAYRLVHSRALDLYLSGSCFSIRAISGTRGSSGLGSHNSEHIDSSTAKQTKGKIISTILGTR